MNDHRCRPRRGAAGCVLAAVLATMGCGPGSLPLTPGLINGTAGDARCGGVKISLNPAQLQRAYQAQPMFTRRVTGAATTVAVIVPFAWPKVAADLAVYSRYYGLPVPVVRQLRYRDAPVARLSDSDAQGWVQEGTYDLEMVHPMAPRAALDFAGSAILASRAGLEAATRAGTTVVAASRDFGPAELEPDGTALYDRPVIAWPASDPLATAGITAKPSITAAMRSPSPGRTGTPDRTLPSRCLHSQEQGTR